MANTIFTGGHNKKWISALLHPGGFFQTDRIFTISIHSEGRLVHATRECVFIDCILISRGVEKIDNAVLSGFSTNTQQILSLFPKSPLDLASSKQNHH